MQRDLSSANNTLVNAVNEELSGRGSGVTRTLEVSLDKTLMAKVSDKLSATQCRCSAAKMYRIARSSHREAFQYSISN